MDDPVGLPQPSDVDDDTHFFLFPDLLLRSQDARQRKCSIRDVLDALFRIARTGAQRGYLPNDFPPAETVRQQAHRSRPGAPRRPHMISESSPESSGSETASPPRSSSTVAPSKARRKADTAPDLTGRKSVKTPKFDTLSHLLAVLTTPANERDRAQAFDLCLEVQKAMGVNVEVAFADQGYTEHRPRSRRLKLV